MEQAENVLEDLRFRILLELDQLNVKHSKAFASLGQELAKKVIHGASRSDRSGMGRRGRPPVSLPYYLMVIIKM